MLISYRYHETETDAAARKDLTAALHTILDYEARGVTPVLTDEDGISHILLHIGVPDSYTAAAVEDSGLAKMMIEMDGMRHGTRRSVKSGKRKGAGPSRDDSQTPDNTGDDIARIVGI